MEIGDIVQLKSGGPNLTIKEIFVSGYKTVTCSWFDKNDNYQTADFDSGMLVFVDK